MMTLPSTKKEVLNMKQSRLALCLKICTIIIAVVAATLLYHILPTGVDVCLEELPAYAWLALPQQGDHLPLLYSMRHCIDCILSDLYGNRT